MKIQPSQLSGLLQTINDLYVRLDYGELIYETHIYPFINDPDHVVLEIEWEVEGYTVVQSFTEGAMLEAEISDNLICVKNTRGDMIEIRLYSVEPFDVQNKFSKQ